MIPNKLYCLTTLFLLFTLTSSSKQPQYTEDLPTFRSDQFNARMQLLTGSWIYAKQHLQLHPQLLEQFKPISFEDLELSLVAKCMRYIRRIDSVSKMKALVEPGSVKGEKKYLDIVGEFGEDDLRKYNEEYGEFLKPFLKKYREDFEEIQKKGFKEEIEKRRKRKLFGIIDIGNANPTIVMGGITVVLVLIVSFVKYRRRVRENDAKKAIAQKER